jgi:dihydroorotate dehydrogenase
MVTVTCVQSVNVIVEGGGMSLIEGETYEMTPEKAKELEALGYVEMGSKTPAPRSGEQAPGMGELPTAPKVPRH